MKNLILGILGLIMLSSTTFAAGIYINPESTNSGAGWSTVGCTYIIAPHECVDEGVPANTSDYVSAYTNNANKYLTFGYEDLPGDATSVNYIIVYSYAKHYNTTNSVFQNLINISGNLSVGNLKNTTSYYAYYGDTYYQNPSTSDNWTVAEINNIEAGVSFSKASYFGANTSQMDIYVNYNTD